MLTKFYLKKFNALYFSVFILSLLILSPFLSIFISLFGEVTEYFFIIKDRLFELYLFNTIILVVSVVSITFILGTFSAFLVSFYEFPGCRFFKWALILSFAVPSYIYGYAFTAFFENYGTAYSIVSFFHNSESVNTYIPKFNGMVGAIISLSFSLYVYVYIFSRSTFTNQSSEIIETSRIFGLSTGSFFLKVLIPLSRPAIITGLSLVAMETLSDFGTVYFFNIPTFTTAIYDSWMGFDDTTTANLLSAFLLIIILIFFTTEKFSRKKSSYYDRKLSNKNLKKNINLHGWASFFAFSFCFLLFFLSFIFPFLQMLYWSFKFPEYFFIYNFFELNLNLLKLIFLSLTLIILVSFFVNYALRILNSNFLNSVSSLSIIGYAVPGLIISIALMSFLSFTSDYFNVNLRNAFIGSITGLVLGYFLRFYSVSFLGIQSNYLKIDKKVDESSYLLGFSKFKTFRLIHLPYYKKPTLLISILLVIEIIKELPITLVMRPFNFETFATKAYSFASQDLLEATAVPSLSIIVWATIFIIFTFKFSDSDK